MLVGTRQLTMGPAVAWIYVAGFTNGSSLVMPRAFTNQTYCSATGESHPFPLGKLSGISQSCAYLPTYLSLTFSLVGWAPDAEKCGCSLLFVLWS